MPWAPPLPALGPLCEPWAGASLPPTDGSHPGESTHSAEDAIQDHLQPHFPNGHDSQVILLPYFLWTQYTDPTTLFLQWIRYMDHLAAFFSRALSIQTDPLTCFSKDTIHSHSSPCFSSGPDTLALTSQTSSHLPVIHILRWGTVASVSIALSLAVSPLAFSHAGPKAGLSLLH